MAEEGSNKTLLYVLLALVAIFIILQFTICGMF